MTLLQNIQQSYELGLTYFDGEINGQEFKIRMNKDHGCNHYRNNDTTIHNLSMVNVKDNTVVFYNDKTGKVQQQVDNILDWSDAEIAVEDFLYNVENM